MRSVETRVERLEQATAPPGKIVPCDLTDDPDPDEQERRLAAAHAEAGENGTVIIVKYEGQEAPEADQEVVLRWPEQFGGE